MNIVKLFLYSWVFVIAQGDYAYGMQPYRAPHQSPMGRPAAHAMQQHQVPQYHQVPQKFVAQEVKRPQNLPTMRGVSCTHGTMPIAIPKQREESDLERLERYQTTAQRQLLNAIFIFLQAPCNLEEKALQLCLAGKNVFLDEHLCPEIKLAERFNYGRDLDPEEDARLCELFGPDEFDIKYPDDFTQLERQNFNPCLFRLVEEYEQVALEIDAQQKAGDGKTLVKTESGDFVSIANSLYILYATFMTYIDDTTKACIKSNVIGEHALKMLQDLSGRYKYGSFLAIVYDDIDLLIKVNEALLKFFLQDLKFEKPRMKFVFQVLPDEQAVLYVHAKKYWMACQKSRITPDLVDDAAKLREAITQDWFLQYRRQEIFYHACNDYDIRYGLIAGLHKMFERKSLTKTMAKLSVSAKAFVYPGEMAEVQVQV